MTSFLCSCFGTPSNNKQIFTYDDFKDKNIKWENLLDQEGNDYLVYIYSEFCGHCEQIKQDVLNYLNSHIDSIYLINYQKDIQICSNIESTIESKDTSQICILGTPTLLKIINKKLEMNIGGKNNILEYLNSN